MKFTWALYIALYTIVTNYNEALAATQAHIDVDTHINGAKVVELALRSICLRQVAYETAASPLQV